MSSVKWATVEPEFGQSIASERWGIEQVEIAHAARRAQFNEVARRLGEPELPLTLETLIAKIEAAGLAYHLESIGAPCCGGLQGHRARLAQVTYWRWHEAPTPLAALVAAARERGIG